MSSYSHDLPTELVRTILRRFSPKNSTFSASSNMHASKLNISLCIFLLIYVPSIISFTFESDSAAKMFGKLRSGFQLAGELLGVDATQGIAQLVASTFGKSNAKIKGESADGGQNIFGGLLRILGLDSKKVGAIAINALIFVAQLVRFFYNKRVWLKVERFVQ